MKKGEKNKGFHVYIKHILTKTTENGGFLTLLDTGPNDLYFDLYFDAKDKIFDVVIIPFKFISCCKT